MSIVNSEAGTRIDEVARGIYRISTPVPPNPALSLGFSFNQLLIAAEAPLLFHTGPRRLFPLVRDAVATVLKPEELRYIGFSHTEGDESGSLREWLELAPQSQALCSQIAAMIFANDASDRPVRAMTDGERLDLGGHEVTWFDAPHVPHGWDAHVLYEETTGTLFCGDLLSQVGDGPALTANDVVDAATQTEDMFGATCLTPHTSPTIRRLAALAPTTLAIMHGSSYNGDAGKALLALADDYEQRLAQAG